LRIFNKSEAPTIEFIVDMIKVSMDFFDFYVIDHLHYIEYSDKNSENVEISKAMRILQTTTGEVKKPIILV
jgi:archaellum biogenesis ATPase FlaH